MVFWSKKMNFRFQRLIIIIILLVFFISACSQTSAQTTNTGVEVLDLSNTRIVLTPTSQVEPPTVTPQPTLTDPPPPPTVTDTDIASDVPSANTTPPKNTPTQSCINQAEFVKHLNVSYNTEFKPNVPFAKVWLVKNTGSCTWSSAYKLTLINGDRMGAPTELILEHDVPPGETIDIRVNLLAPTKPSTYENSWMLQDENGNTFGVGTSGNEPLRVQIVVIAPYNPPRL